ncbi:MAG: hypothetical protein ACPL3C_07000 [Pyrobaculum sp.]
MRLVVTGASGGIGAALVRIAKSGGISPSASRGGPPRQTSTTTATSSTWTASERRQLRWGRWTA